ncbi:glycosyltransferase family 2 protein [Anaerovibrio slackiae]|uniref:glycosyltransferase family 2 protein n=1 Tax=Anaerovibrio slackiae TaxID=2652309 RepID=UPI003F184FE0
MINVLIPSMSKTLFFAESYFPKPLIEIDGKTMLEQVVNNYQSLQEKKFIFVFEQKDCAEFHLDESASILTDGKSNVIVLENETAGALCTCLMAIEFIPKDEPLFIANCDQIIDIDYKKMFDYFEDNQADAGIVTFESIHPRWSYAKIADEEVVEVAEKRPLSKHAIAGCYYYRRGKDFIDSAQQAILKGNAEGGRYYISSTMNEMILKGKKVVPYYIDRCQYHTFYSPDKIKEYERYIQGAGR